MIKLQGRSRIIAYDETLKLVREGQVVYVDGKPFKYASETFEVRGNVQPVAGRELLLVPEGDRFKEQYFLWTSDVIKVNDRIVRCDVNYQVQTVETWGSYYRAHIMRIDTGPNATP